MVNLRPIQMQARRPLIGGMLIASLVVAGCAMAYYSMTPRFVVPRLEAAADRSDGPAEQVYLYSQAMALAPDADRIVLKRIRAFFTMGRYSNGLNDAQVLIAKGEQLKELNELAEELSQDGHPTESWELRRMLAHAGQSI
jgi:hypothetical protein